MFWKYTALDARQGQKVRREFLHLLRTYGAPKSDFAAAELICGELLANAIRYAPGTIELHLDWDEVQPVLTVVDEGKGFVPNFESPADFQEHGRGMYIISALSSNICVDSTSKGTEISATLPVWRSGRPFGPDEVLREA
ncbi:MAG: hypothetical protein NVSMB31_11910 [Vulcanimicrobiaceae bacterium]